MVLRRTERDDWTRKGGGENPHKPWSSLCVSFSTPPFYRILQDYNNTTIENGLRMPASLLSWPFATFLLHIVRPLLCVYNHRTSPAAAAGSSLDGGKQIGGSRQTAHIILDGLSRPNRLLSNKLAMLREVRDISEDIKHEKSRLKTKEINTHVSYFPLRFPRSINPLWL